MHIARVIFANRQGSDIANSNWRYYQSSLKLAVSGLGQSYVTPLPATQKPERQSRLVVAGKMTRHITHADVVLCLAQTDPPLDFAAGKT